MFNHFKLIKDLKQNFKLSDALSIFKGLYFENEQIHIPSKNRTIHLRKNTKDEETFLEVFQQNIYNSPLTFTPKTIIDAGANSGLASLYFKLKYPDSSIVTLEIETENTAMIRKNLQGFKDIDILEKALYYKKAFFKVEDPYNATNSFVIKEVPEGSAFDIESTTIDEIIANKNWDIVDILKIDIEGSEKELFENNYQHWLPKIKVIYVETHDRMIPKCSYAVMKAINEFDEFILYTTTQGTLIYYNTNLVELPT